MVHSPRSAIASLGAVSQALPRCKNVAAALVGLNGVRHYRTDAPFVSGSGIVGGSVGGVKERCSFPTYETAGSAPCSGRTAQTRAPL